MKIKILIIALGLLAAHQAQACVIALTNDTNKPFMIVTDDFKEGMLLPANGFVEFGSKAYMANFRVMQQNSKNFTQQYHVQQTACTPGKYTKLSMSQIKPGNKTIPFNISMIEVQKIQPKKAGCGCGN